MYELVDSEDTYSIVGEYDTLAEAKESKEMYLAENPERYYTIYKVVRVAVD